MSDRAAKVKVKDLGLTQVYCSEKPLVDIVFVHGLNGHPHKTWSTNDVFWPADLLPPMLDQHRVRVLTYGYNASVVAFTDGVSRDRVHNHAETLASALAANRNLRNCSDRPIIFVCHSLGGLVVKRALIYCRSVSNEKIEHLRSIFVSTYGILFLGTPHNGSDIAKWGLLLQNICSAVLPKKVMDTSGDLVKALRTNNETLQNINSLFADIIGRFHIFFFHETRSTDVKGTREMIVDESSAAPYIDGVERSGIDADHSHMCKFEDDNAPGFESVADALFRYARDAPHAILDRWVEEEKTRLIARQAKAREIFNNENMSPSPSVHNAHPTENPPDRLALKGRESPEPGPSVSTATLALSRSSLKGPLFVAPTGFHPNATFFGMTRELDILHSRLFRAKKRAERLVAVLICGGPGFGKSHLARQYIFTHRDCYAGGIFWVDAKSRESTSKCFWDIAQAAMLTDELEFESPDSKTPQRYVEVVRNWFQTREEWLLVFDGLNFDHEDDLNHFKQFLPFNKRCSIIYTSVDRTLRKKQRLYEPYCLQVPPLTVEDACKLLFKDLGIKRPSKEQIRKGTELVNHYECLPLAIHAISHRLSAMSKPIEKYHIDSHLTDEKLAEPFLSIMRDLFRMNHLEALSLINILSFLGHHVPVGLINLGRPALEVLNVQILTSSRPGERPDIDTTLGILIKYGLIERTSDAYALHPRNLSPQSEKDNILEAGDVIPDLSESQTESSQEAFFSVYQSAGSIDVIKIHSVVQGFCRDELKIMDEEMRKQPDRPDTPKYAEDYYPSWLVVATRVLCRSYENAKKRMDHVDDYGLVKDYREYETQASRLVENFPRRRSSEPEIVREARIDLRQMMKSISDAIHQLSPSSSQDSVRKHRSVFDRSSSSSSSMPDSSFDDGPSRQLTWDLNDMVAVKVESPKEMPPAAHQFNLSPFIPHIFRESSSGREGYESDNEYRPGETRISPAHSHISQSTEKPSPSQPPSPPRDDQGWQVVEKPQKPRPGKERQPKQRPKFPRHIQGARLAAPVLEIFPVEGRSISNSSLNNGRSSSSVSATEALTAVHNASSPRTSEEDIHWAGTEHGSGNKENSRTWAAVAAKAKRAVDVSSPTKRASSSSLGAEVGPSLLGTQPLQGKSSVKSLDTRPSTGQGPSPPRETQIERMSRSTYSEPSQDYLAQHLNALDLRAAPESRYHARQLSAVAPMAAAPLRDMSASSPSLLPYYPPPIPYENQIEIAVARRLNATAQQVPAPAPVPISQTATNLNPILHPSAIMPGASPPSSLMAEAVGYGGYISDPPPVLEPMSRGPSGQSQQSWSTEPVRFPPRFPPMPATAATMGPFLPQQQTLSGAGSWIGDGQQPGGFGAGMPADIAFAARTQTRPASSLDSSLHGREFGWEGEPVPNIAFPPSATTLHFGAHQVDVRDARQRFELSSRYPVQGPSAPAYHLYHSNRSGPLMRQTQEMAIPGPAQGAYDRRARSGSSPLNPDFHHLGSNL